MVWKALPKRLSKRWHNTLKFSAKFVHAGERPVSSRPRCIAPHHAAQPYVTVPCRGTLPQTCSKFINATSIHCILKPPIQEEEFPNKSANPRVLKEIFILKEAVGTVAEALFFEIPFCSARLPLFREIKSITYLSLCVKGDMTREEGFVIGLAAQRLCRRSPHA